MFNVYFPFGNPLLNICKNTFENKIFDSNFHMDVSSNENIIKMYIIKIHLKKNFQEFFFHKQTSKEWMILENDSASSNFYFYLSMLCSLKIIQKEHLRVLFLNIFISVVFTVIGIKQSLLLFINLRIFFNFFTKYNKFIVISIFSPDTNKSLVLF